MRQAGDVRDVLQETFVRAARSGVNVESLESPRAWLVTLARRTLTDWLRRESSRTRHHLAAAQELPLLAQPAADPDAAVMREQIDFALCELPAEQRAAVVLHLWGGLTFREIAQSMDVPLHTAASRCRYGLERLRRQLNPLYQEIR